MISNTSQGMTRCLELREFLEVQGRRIKELEALVVTKENTARLHLERVVELQEKLAKAETTEPSGR